MNGSEIPAASEDQQKAEELHALDPNCIVVQSMEDLQCLSLEILSERDYAIVGLAPSAEQQEPALAPVDIRPVVGPAARIYVFDGEELLPGLREMLGLRLTVQRGSARIWWPGASVSSDPADHPLVACLAGERREDALEEFARQFDLSRPVVRSQIRLIDDMRACLEYELARIEERNRRLSERLRDTQIESHRRLTQAQALEARLNAGLGESAPTDSEPR